MKCIALLFSGLFLCASVAHAKTDGPWTIVFQGTVTQSFGGLEKIQSIIDQVVVTREALDEEIKTAKADIQPQYSPLPDPTIIGWFVGKVFYRLGKHHVLTVLKEAKAALPDLKPNDEILIVRNADEKLAVIMGGYLYSSDSGVKIVGSNLLNSFWSVGFGSEGSLSLSFDADHQDWSLQYVVRNAFYEYAKAEWGKDIPLARVSEARVPAETVLQDLPSNLVRLTPPAAVPAPPCQAAFDAIIDALNAESA